tara:strand:- start:2 stop:799 length:798 start_codon:yes stop_codon:yes gene_type:complete
MDVIIVTPAGRKIYLEKLYKHLCNQKTDFKEWHLWVNTYDQNDIEYMKVLEKENNWIKLVYTNLIKNISRNLNIHKFFRYAVDPDTVYIRLDDDIVWLENNFIKKLSTFRIENPEFFLVYANIVNNNVIDHIHQNNGAIQNVPNIDNHCMGNSWKNASFAHEIHTQFINARKNNNIDIWKFKPQLTNSRVSINAISWIGPSFSEFAEDRARDEEQFLSCDYPRLMKKMNIIYGDALCVHLGFHTQRDDIIKGKRLDDRIDEISDI